MFGESTMRFETTRDLLKTASELHESLARYYQRLSDSSSKERVRMLLDYLSRHEKNLAQVVSRFGTEAAEAVRNAWFSYEFDGEFVKCIPPAQPVDSLSLDEIIDLAITLDDCISDIYQMVALQSGLPEVREAFLNLVNMEREEKKRMVRQAMQLNEM